jgi:hypothetical protein
VVLVVLVAGVVFSGLGVVVVVSVAGAGVAVVVVALVEEPRLSFL